jgi:hypothetical protein
MLITLLNAWTQLCLIYVCFKLNQRRLTLPPQTIKFEYEDKKLRGILSKVQIDSKIAEKFAERAFNLASAANLGIVALQKSLATPRIMTKEQVVKNTLAKEQIDELFTGGGSMDWLRPILSDEELEILDKAEEERNKIKDVETQ